MRAGAQVMRIAPTESNIAPKQYETQRHKPPTKKYYVKAPEVQIDYNAYKCKADQFNKAIHEYTHIGMPVNDEVTFTQKFIAVSHNKHTPTTTLLQKIKFLSWTFMKA